MFWYDEKCRYLKGRVGDIAGDDGRDLCPQVGRPIWFKYLDGRLESEFTYLIFTDN
jgi:hypothetical protein